MRMQTAKVCKPGGNGVNEDAAGGLPQAEDFGCWALADGHGKRGGGDVAAQKSVNAMLAVFKDRPALSSKVLWRAFEAANQEIAEMQAELVRHMSIRVAAALLCYSGRAVWWAHIGDARVYVFRGGELVSRTFDHSVPQTLVGVGEITPAQLRTHPAHHRLLRALGAPGATQPAVLERRFELREGDLFLLCSAGFWRHVTEMEMLAEWCKSEDAADWLERLEIRLLQAAPADYEDYSAIALLARD